MNGLAALLAGLLFGAGLVVSGMANPDKVLAFLRLGPGWDPALALVMAAAVLVTSIGYALANRRDQPLFHDRFHLPGAADIDARLLVGSALFGVGWGLAGYCPGPALVGAMLLDPRALVFLAAFVVGLYGFEFTLGRPAATAAPADRGTGRAATDG